MAKGWRAGGTGAPDSDTTQLEGLPPGFPTAWLPDETLYSLCSRYHRMAGSPSADTTCRLLYGHAGRGSQHDLPAFLDHFVERTRGVLGSADDVAKRHTLLSYYLPVHSKAFADQVIANLRVGGVGSLKFRLGLLTTRFRANHPLKLCDRCLVEDAQLYHVAYWHLSHQLPGAWICLKHARRLQEALEKHNGVDRFEWLLPVDVSLTPPASLSLTAPMELQLSRLATAATALSTLAPGDLGPLAVARATAAGMEARGYPAGATAPGSSLSRDFLAFCAPLRSIPELMGLPTTPAASSSFLRRSLHASGTAGHPIRLMTLALFLFEDLGAFLDASRVEQSWAPAVEERPTVHQSKQDMRRNEAVSLWNAGLRSCRQIATQLGLDTSTVISWLAGAGIEVSRRPKIIKPKLRQTAIAKLRRGAPKGELAKTLGISAGTLSRLIASEPGLAAAWQEAHMAQALRKARLRWMTALRRGGEVSVARDLDPATYAWLYRNDRHWMGEYSAKIAPRRTGNNSAVNWDSRDQDFERKIRQLSVALREQGHTGRITLQMLATRLPDLRAKQDQLHRMPRTLRLIRELGRHFSTHKDGQGELE